MIFNLHLLKTLQKKFVYELHGEIHVQSYRFENIRFGIGFLAFYSM
jgi:hypothetical protein